MATSLAAQVEAIASTRVHVEEARKRPFTRLSILFDPREAADISVDTIHTAALEGLDKLAAIDKRFASFKKTLFSFESVQIDREVQNREYNAKLDKSIAVYLRLVSGHLLLAVSHKTLEYLIRRYKIYAYNLDDVILCALPYHETSLFVRIVQVLNLKKTKWHFLEGVKEAGAPPPRALLVQQCTREMAILEAICEYNMPIKSQSYSRTSVSFCVAVIMETLGAVTTVNTDLINKILPFIFRCLDPMVVQDYKVGGLMIVGKLADRAVLSEKLIKQLICILVKAIHKDVNTLDGVSLLDMVLMVMIKLTQAQTIDVIPWKALEVLANISDLTVSLHGLSKTFYVETFLSLFLDGLIYYSFQQKSCQTTLISIIDAVPMKGQIVHVVSKILGMCTGSSLTTLKSEKMQHDVPEARDWTRCILLKIEKLYPAELDEAVCNFLENSREVTKQSESSGSVLEILQMVFSGSLHIPMEESNASVYVSLEHPQPQIRAAAVSSLATLGIVETADRDTKTTINIQEALLRRLHDDDLSVVHAALSLEGLAGTIDHIPLLKALNNILSRCFLTLRTGSKASKDQAYAVADLSLEFTVSSFLVQNPYCLKEAAALIMPYVLILPKTWTLNQKALKLAGRISGPFFHHLSSALDLRGSIESKKLEENWLMSVNCKIIGALSDALLENLETYMPWLIECCSELPRLKPLLFLIFINCFMQQREGKFWHLLKGCLPFIKQEWSDVDSRETIIQTKPNSMNEFFSQPEMYQQIESENQTVYGHLLIAIFWSLLKNFPKKTAEDSHDEKRDNSSVFEDLFVFFAMSSSKDIFKEHIHLLVTHSSVQAVPFLSNFFMAEGSTVPVAVQVESLNALSFICFALSSAESSERNGMQSVNSMHLQLALPCILVALCSAVQAVRRAATKCIQALHDLWCCITISSQKYDTEPMHKQYLRMDIFGKFLESIVQLKEHFDSDGNFLGPFLNSSLNSSRGHIAAPDNLRERCDESTKEAVLLFILRNALEFPTYAKWKILSMLQGSGHISRQVAEMKEILSDLLSRREGFYLKCDISWKKLSHDDIQLLCVLLKTYMLHLTSANLERKMSRDVLEPMFEALFVERVSQEDAAVTKPCILVLESLSSTFYDCQNITVQDEIFQRLVVLFSSDIGAIRNAALDALRRININGSTVAKHLGLVLGHDDGIHSPPKQMKRSKLEKCQLGQLSSKVVLREAECLYFVSALLELLIWKKDLENRVLVIEPLCRLLDKIIKEEPLGNQKKKEMKSPKTGYGSSHTSYLQQMVLTILESISNSLLMETSSKVGICKSFNVDLVVQCMNVAKDSSTRNHALSLVTTLAKLIPEQVLGYAIDIFTIMRESTIIQDDSHSQQVSKELISAVIPCWLTTNKDPQKLLEVFIKALPQMSQRCKFAITKHLLGVIGEDTSLPLLLLLMLQEMIFPVETIRSSMEAQDMKRIPVDSKWQYEFCVQLSIQYPSRIWLSCLVKLLERTRIDACILNQGKPQLMAEESLSWVLQREAAHLIEDYLKSSEFLFQFETGHDQSAVQEVLGALMEQVVLQLQILESKIKRSVIPYSFQKNTREVTFSLLNAVTKLMVPAAYSKGITSLLKNSDANVCQKALQLICQNLKAEDGLAQQPKKKNMLTLSNELWQSLGQSKETCEEMILEIVGFLNRSQEDSSVVAKIAAVSTLDVLTKKFAGNFPKAFITCLNSVVANLKANDITFSSRCLCCIASLVSELGPQALEELPHIVEFILEKTQQVCSSSSKEGTDSNTTDSKENSEARDTFLISVLSALDAIVNKLGGFMNPYLEEIVGLLVLHSEFTCVSDSAVGTKAASIRTLTSEKISVRLLLDPILRVYEKAVKTGENSVSAIFEMLAVAAAKMDRQSVSTYHAKIFKSCLVALDLCHHHSEYIKDVAKVETSIVNALVALTLKLNEATFKPLFVRTLEWAESDVESKGSSTGHNLQRNISFYTFVDSLIGKLRSVFVPYFQYLMDGCVHHLTGGQYGEANVQAEHKRKRSKLIEKTAESGSKRTLTKTEWHLRMLAISSLHKCFLYDTVGFLDDSKFQVLLKPVVSQLVVDPPEVADLVENVPSIQEADDLLVSCLGQMALTAGTDLLWKPLNHEVLMQTRSKKVRARILGLRIVKFLLEHLKEEYLVLLPETIPFLGELLEDSELEVVAKAQEIFKSMEDMSGESLSQYL